MSNIIRMLAREFKSYAGAHLVNQQFVDPQHVGDWWFARLPSELGIASPMSHRQIYKSSCDVLFRLGLHKRKHGFVRIGPTVRIKRNAPLRPDADVVYVDPEPAPSGAHVQSALRFIPPAESVSMVLALHTDFPDGEARVRDIDLGTFLGYANPRKIREIIDRHSDTLGQRPAVGRRPERGGTPVSEDFLTERQCLMVLRWCDTAKADACYAHIVDVFLAWRQGRLAMAAPSPASTGPDVLGAVLQQTMSTMASVASLLDRLTTRLLDAPQTGPTPVAVTPAPRSGAPWDYVSLPLGEVPRHCASVRDFLAGKRTKIDRRDLGTLAKAECERLDVDAYSVSRLGLKYVEHWYPTAVLNDVYRTMIAGKRAS